MSVNCRQYFKHILQITVAVPVIIISVKRSSEKFTSDGYFAFAKACFLKLQFELTTHRGFFFV